LADENFVPKMVAGTARVKLKKGTDAETENKKSEQPLSPHQDAHHRRDDKRDNKIVSNAYGWLASGISPTFIP